MGITRSLLLFGFAATAAITLVRHEIEPGARSARAPSGQRASEAGGPRSAEDAADDDARTGSAAANRDARVLDDETGAPVAGARVTYYRTSWRTRTEEAIETVVTDDAGSVAPPADACVDALVVRADGYPPTAFAIEREEKDLRLGRGATRTFTIVDEDGNPGAYAEVDVFWGYEMFRLYTEAADARGMVTLWLAGNERLLVRLLGYGYEEAEGATIVLKREYTIGGRVVDSAGRPIGGAQVRVRQGCG